jgi:magnesium transporter
MSKRKTTAIIRQISFDPEKRVDIFRTLSDSEKVEVLYWLTPHIEKDLLTRLNDEEALDLIEKVDPDEATDLLQLIGKRRRTRLIEHLSESLKETISDLLQFDPDTAAGLMTLDYILVDASATIEDVARKFKAHERKTGRLPVVLALRDGKLTGFLPGHELGFVRKSERITNYIKKVPVIPHAADHDEVIDLFRSHPHNKVVVLDDNKNVMGIIYSDDVLQLMHEQEASTLYDFAGIHDEESVTDSAGRKIRYRYKWLIINLGTAFLAAFTVNLFQDTLSKFVLLAVYMPIVAGMGGNAATQTLAVMVRGISQRQIDRSTALRTLKNEMGAGFVNGSINGVLVAAIVILLNHDYKIALILALAMVVGFLAFLGLATLLLY